MTPINVFLKPHLNWWNSLALSDINKVSTGTWSFVSVIGNFVPCFVASAKSQYLDEARMRLIF